MTLCCRNLFPEERGSPPGYLKFTKKVLQGELLKLLHMSFPSVSGNGIPMHKFEITSYNSSRHNSF